MRCARWGCAGNIAWQWWIRMEGGKKAGMDETTASAGREEGREEGSYLWFLGA